MKFNDAIKKKKGHTSQSHGTEIFSVTVNLKCSLTVFIYIHWHTLCQKYQTKTQHYLCFNFSVLFTCTQHFLSFLLENLLIDYYYPKHPCIHEKFIFCIKMGTDLPLKTLSNISRFQQSHSGLYIKDKSLFGWLEANICHLHAPTHEQKAILLYV